MDILFDYCIKMCMIIFWWVIEESYKCGGSLDNVLSVMKNNLSAERSKYKAIKRI